MNLGELRARLWWELDNGSNIDELAFLHGGNDTRLINEAIRDLVDCIQIIKHDTALYYASTGVVTLPTDVREILSVKFGTTELTPENNPTLLNIGSDSTTQYMYNNSKEITLYDTPVPFVTGLTVAANGTTGATSYGYAVVTVTAEGYSLLCAEVKITNGNATLSAINHNQISWTAVTDATDYKIYRLTSGGTPSSLGYIGTDTGAVTFDDTGIAATVDEENTSTFDVDDYRFHLWYKAYPPALVDDDDVPYDIPTEFHEGLIMYYCRAQYMKRFNYQEYQDLIMFWNQVFKKNIMRVIESRSNPVQFNRSWEW
ncbi:MAG: hypothetical protein PHR07_04480 [Acidaminococcaceae bacterium]|nr:hypothetical protein [Acidaminococcaceae bacterium]